MHPFRRGRSYKRHLDSSGHAYTPTRSTSSPYIIPTDTWYILHIRATKAQPDILQTPAQKRVRSTKVQRSLIVGLEDSNW